MCPSKRLLGKLYCVRTEWAETAGSPAVAHFQLKQRCSFGKENTHYWHVRAWSIADVSCTCEVCNCRSTSSMARGHAIKNDGEAWRGCPTCPGLLARPSVIIPERGDCQLTTSSDGRLWNLMWNSPPHLEMLPYLFIENIYLYIFFLIVVK